MFSTIFFRFQGKNFLLLLFFGSSVSFGQETGEVKAMDKMDKIEESLLVNTTQKTEPVNMKEGRGI